MPDLSALIAARANFADVMGRFTELMTNQSAGWQRRQLVLRRALQEAITEIGSAGRDFLGEEGDKLLLHKFEHVHARYRHHFALHVANWPVVSVIPTDKDYLQSVEEARISCRTFIEMVDDIIKSH